jgi:hypothetical protein
MFPEGGLDASFTSGNKYSFVIELAQDGPVQVTERLLVFNY